MQTPRSRSRLRMPAVTALGVLLAVTACTSSSGNGTGNGSGTRASNNVGAQSAAGGSAATVAASPDNSGFALQTDYENTVKAVLPSVVQITAGDSLGSGVVYDDKGDIVTNAHVVGTQTSFTVTLANNSASLPAKLVFAYPANDLAVIKLQNPPSGLHPVTWADSGKVNLGQIVLAMGNPLGLTSSVTEGIVSAVGRTVTEPRSSDNPNGATIPDMVQTSAAINPGNSGGALVNLNNQIVGINTLAAVDSGSDSSSGSSAGQAPGIGFAIPASTVTRLADQIIKDGKVTNSGRAALGVTVRTLFVGEGAQQGVSVVTVNDNGPAAKAGIQAGDVITKVDGQATPDTSTLNEVLAGLTPGQKVAVDLVRNDSNKTVHVTLGTL